MALPVPDNEEERLRALERYKILDTAPEEAFDRITRLAATALGVPIALVSLVDRDRQWFKSRQGLTAEQTPRDVAFCAHAICNEDVLVVPDATKDPRFAENPLVTADPNVRFYAGAPLRTQDGYNLGTLCVIDHRPHELTESHKKLLAELAAIVMSEFEIRVAGRSAVKELSEKDRHARELHRLATTDSLTGALNRRAFLEIAQQEYLRAKRYERPLSLLMLDVDNFKRINDEHGHSVGDAVLKALADKASACLRSQDALGRIGGEEFAILVPETTAANACALGERLREAFASLCIETATASLQFTVSIGVTECACATETVDNALKRADVALYSAKNGGRNRVELRYAS